MTFRDLLSQPPGGGGEARLPDGRLLTLLDPGKILAAPEMQFE